MGSQGHKTNLFDAPVHRMSDQPLMVVMDLEGNRFSVFANALHAIGRDQGLRQLEFGLLQGIVAGHILIIAVEIAVKDQSNLSNGGVAIKGIADAVPLVTDPQILLAAVTAVAHDVRIAFCILRPQLSQ